MSSFLYLIRYPSVDLDPNVAASHWQLSEFGLYQSHLLAELAIWVETPVDFVCNSADMKSIQAAEIILKRHPHLKHRSLMSLNESQRSVSYLPDEEYNRCAYNFFTYPDKIAMSGWERCNSMRTLVVGMYQELIAELKQQHKSAAIISHGIALTLLRGYILGRPATYADWLQVPFASWASVNLNTGQLDQDFQMLETAKTGATT